MAMMRSTAGDVADFGPMFAACEQWYGAEVVELYGGAPVIANGLLMGCPLWGQDYIDRFLKYCLPTMLSPANLDVLRGASRLLLFTAPANYIYLVERLRLLEDCGIRIQVRLIPDPVVAQISAHWINKLWVLGTAHNICVRIAGRLGMGFHMLQPDHVYPSEYFPSLLQRSHYDGVLQNGICTQADDICPELEAYRQGGALTIGARDLCTLGVKHLHPHHGELVMNSRNLTDRLPVGSWLAWRGTDKLHIAFPHTHIAWMSPRACQVAPSRIPATLDAEVPKLIPRNWYMAKADDGLGFIELSPADKSPSPGFRTFRQFATRVWSTLKFNPSYLPYYRQMCELPLHPQPDGMPEELIHAQHLEIVDALDSEPVRGQAAWDFARSLDHTEDQAA